MSNTSIFVIIERRSQFFSWNFTGIFLQDFSLLISFKKQPLHMQLRESTTSNFQAGLFFFCCTTLKPRNKIISLESGCILKYFPTLQI